MEVVSPETFRLLIMLAGVVISNYTAVRVITAHMSHMNSRIDVNDKDIEQIKKDTRYVMSGNEIRKILHDEVNPLKKKVELTHDLVIGLKAAYALRTASGKDEDL